MISSNRAPKTGVLSDNIMRTCKKRNNVKLGGGRVVASNRFDGLGILAGLWPKVRSVGGFSASW